MYIQRSPLASHPSGQLPSASGTGLSAETEAAKKAIKTVKRTARIIDSGERQRILNQSCSFLLSLYIYSDNPLLFCMRMTMDLNYRYDLHMNRLTYERNRSGDYLCL